MKPELLPQNQVNPWVFHRDEFNLLEEAFEGILRQHDKSIDGAAFPLEEQVIKEQLDTEEATENELASRIGVDWLDIVALATSESIQHVDDTLSLRDALKQNGIRDPLYQKAREWALAIHRWTKGEYIDEGVEGYDMYRAHLNVLLVPIKIAFAVTEEQHEDKHSADIADKEFQLAETYLDRVRESLLALNQALILPEAIQRRLQESVILMECIHAARERLAERRRFGGASKNM